VRYWALYGQEEGRRVSEESQGSGKDRAVGEPEPPLRSGGLPLPGLQHWRLRRGLSQTDLARRADLTNDYVARIEAGRRGCNPAVAQNLADVLKVDLQELRRKYEDTVERKVPPKLAGTRVAYRKVHQAYLKMFLEGAVGSSFAAMDEWEIEKHCQESTWEEVIEAVWARKREIECLGETLEARGVLQDPDLPAGVRSFLEAVLKSFPDLDIHLLAMVRRREPTEEGHEALTKAMRGLL